MIDKSIILKGIGERCRAVRMRYGMSQKSFAKAIEVNPSVVCRFEQGKSDSAYLLYCYHVYERSNQLLEMIKEEMKDGEKHSGSDRS